MRILVAGDICPQRRVKDQFDQGDYESVLGAVKPIITQADYAIVNFECPVCYGNEKPIIKCGPNLCCSERGVDAVKWAGFNCVTLANNHFLDFGEKGVYNTISACKTKGIDTVGGGINITDASSILYKAIGNETLAIINCCEHEFSIATKTSAGSNPLNPVEQYYAIKEARKKADFVLVIVHGGHELYQLPSPRMQETYRFFIDAGADAVVNHHQHCYSGYEVYNEKPIFYGLGNFCFDWAKMKEMWYWGYMVELSCVDRRIKFDVIPYSQCLDKPVIIPLKSESIERKIKSLNDIIADKSRLSQAIDKYYSDNLLDSNLMIEPVSNRYIRALQNRRLLPAYHYRRSYLIRLYNFLLCEAHVDKIHFFLEAMYKRITK